MDKHVPAIVVTGGPKSDKTKVLEHLRKYFTLLGYRVEIIRGIKRILAEAGKGVSRVTKENFQAEIFTTMLEEEWQKKRYLATKAKPLLLVERGAVDGIARIGREAMMRIWDTYDGRHLVHLRDGRYEGVIHLRTRLPEAMTEDNRIRDAWMGTPHFAYITAADPDERRQEACIWAESFLSGIEHERKYNLLVPTGQLVLPEHAQGVQIRQFYANIPGDKPPRIRARGQGEYFLYSQTVKRNIDDISCCDQEVLIDEARFEELEKEENRVPELAEICKTRICFVGDNGFYNELDVFHDFPGRMHLEIEFPHPSWRDRAVPPSDFLGKVEEVTGSKLHTNKAYARERAEMKLAA